MLRVPKLSEITITKCGVHRCCRTIHNIWRFRFSMIKYPLIKNFLELRFSTSGPWFSVNIPDCSSAWILVFQIFCHRWIIVVLLQISVRYSENCPMFPRIPVFEVFLIKKFAIAHIEWDSFDFIASKSQLRFNALHRSRKKSITLTCVMTRKFHS